MKLTTQTIFSLFVLAFVVGVNVGTLLMLHKNIKLTEMRCNLYIAEHYEHTLDFDRYGFPFPDEDFYDMDWLPDSLEYLQSPPSTNDSRPH